MSEILVVGAGPVGLTAALELIRRGIAVDVIDRRSEISNLSRALAVMPRTLEFLNSSGVADRIVESGYAVRGFRLFRDGELAEEFDFGRVDSHYDRLVITPQTNTETALLAELEALGGEVHRGITFESLEQHPDGVDVTTKGPNGTRTARYHWVIGADGAHSHVRDALGIGFEGHTLAGRLELMDAKVECDFDPLAVSVHTSGHHVAALFPLPNGDCRIVTESMAEHERQVTRETMNEALEEVGITAEIGEVSWTSSFVLQSRVAEHYRSGRVYLAGDACHSHSPLGGQGMNMGIQDAATLAWMMAGVLRGELSADVLEAYEQERRPIAERIVAATDRATRAVLLNQGALVWLMMRAGVTVLNTIDAAKERLKAEVTGLAQRYESPIIAEDQAALLDTRLASESLVETPTVRSAATFESGPVAGTRAPHASATFDGRTLDLIDILGNEKHSVLLFDGRARTEEGYERMENVATILGSIPGARVFVVTPSKVNGLDTPQLIDPGFEMHDKFNAVSECLYVIRPDGVIGYRQQPINLELLAAWWNRVFAHPLP